MEGGVGSIHSDFAVFAFCIVEDHGGGGDAAPEGVDAAAAKFLAGVRSVFFFAKGDLGPEPRGLVGFDGFSADLPDESSGKSEGLITDHPRGQAVAGSASEQAVFGISFEGNGVNF